MNEQHKLTEALYFLSHLGPSSLDPQEYSFELSAFLTAARSVLQYARKEAITKPGGQEWYDKHGMTNMCRMKRLSTSKIRGT